MNTPENIKVLEIVDRVKSWIPRKMESTNMSRDFWMPDQSCRVCYECDLQFNIFNRRHHCRLCGRVFCSKCTTNSIPTPCGDEDLERIRVCNYCFKQWVQGVAMADTGMSASSTCISRSVSATSLVSSNSSSNSQSSASSTAYSTGPYQHIQSPCSSVQMNTPIFKKDQRSDDEEDEYNVYPPNQIYETENTESNYDNTTLKNVEVQNTERAQNLVQEADKEELQDSPSYECNIEPVDFENNDLLWFPPDPKNEEDEIETIEDDDEDGVIDTSGEWGYLRNSTSSIDGEYKNRDRSVEEHRTAMKNALDGHFKALISQLLQSENLPVTESNSNENWLNIITSLSWEAATLLKPDTSKSGGMDPGGYVKIKCIACGQPSQSTVIKGVVCKKNVAHRRMTSKIEKPRLLILGGALEYQRVANHLSSFDTLLQQEMDHLKMAVAKIDSYKPNILLVEKSVSRFAQEYLLAKNISLVLNVRKPLLERISRCTGAKVVPSIDHLTTQILGYCEAFHVEKFLEEHGSAGQNGKKTVKTLMFFQGCPKPFGCTILLKGTNGDELKKVKHVLQYGVFAAYHLALETSFLADEGASLPELPLKSPVKVVLPDTPSSLDRSISTISNFTISTPQTPNDSSGSIHTIYQDLNGPNLNGPNRSGSEEIMGDNNNLIRVIGDENGKVVTKEEFILSPSDPQSILVSLTTRCVLKGTVCERAHLFRIKYYGSFDKPLGCFLRDNLFDQNYRCRSCEMPSEAHIHCYTHQQGSLTISVKKLQNCILPGEKEGKIWMWHRCLKCPRTKGFPPSNMRVIMSDAAWGLSFGKFVELSFSNHAAATRVANCGHSLHRDCLRFYGFGQMVACFRYNPIVVNSVYLPPSKLEFNKDGQDWIHKEVDEVRVKAELLFDEVLRAIHEVLKRYSVDNELCQLIPELEVMLRKEKQDFEGLLRKVVSKVKVDILEMNKLMRQLIYHAYIWDLRLTHVHSLSMSNIRGNISPKIGDKHGKGFGSFDSFLLNEKQPDITFDGAHKGIDNSECVSSSVRRVVSEGQFPVIDNLSDTLDAAWTGESLVNKDNKNDKHSEVNYAPTLALPTKLLDNIENSLGWVWMPFPSLLNKNSLMEIQKFCKLTEYNPVYISSFRKLIGPGPGPVAGPRLLLPPGVNDTVVPIYDDEPTSIIAYALASQNYQIQISDEPEKFDSSNLHSLSSLDESSSSSSSSLSGLDPHLYTNALHARVSFSDDGPLKVKYNVTCYYAKRFEALRRICVPFELDFVRSLSRCKKWGAQGGKSNVFFAKTLDDRFIIKQVTKTELESFIKFAPSYFKYLSESISTGSPTCLAKILGIYQVTSKQVKGGKEIKMDVLVMENLLYKRNITLLYDLKGSSRSRYNSDSSGSNKVLLDQNLIETMPTSPIFVGTKAKRLLERAVWNDTSFLASIDVMDYSLLVGIDEEKQELVLGIIDFMRQYTWDKHLETWVKTSGILGGPKNVSPTVISPEQYKKRFRKAMSAYFLMVPDQWSSLTVIPTRSQSDISNEKSFLK